MKPFSNTEPNRDKNIITLQTLAHSDIYAMQFALFLGIKIRL